MHPVPPLMNHSCCQIGIFVSAPSSSPGRHLLRAQIRVVNACNAISDTPYPPLLDCVNNSIWIILNLTYALLFTLCAHFVHSSGAIVAALINVAPSSGAADSVNQHLDVGEASLNGGSIADVFRQTVPELWAVMGLMLLRSSW